MIYNIFQSQVAFCLDTLPFYTAAFPPLVPAKHMSSAEDHPSTANCAKVAIHFRFQDREQIYGSFSTRFTWDP